MNLEQIRSEQLYRDIEQGADVMMVLKMAYTIGQEDFRKELKLRVKELPGKQEHKTGYYNPNKLVSIKSLGL